MTRRAPPEQPPLPLVSDILVEILAWAALGTWWERNPSGAAAPPWAPEEEALGAFVHALPEPLMREIGRAYRARRDPIQWTEIEAGTREAGG